MVHNIIHLKSLFTHPIRLIEAEIQWVNDLLDEIKEGKYDY